MQDQFLAQCQKLCLSQDAKFSELKSTLDLLTIKVFNLKAENVSLHDIIKALQVKIAAMESTFTNLQSSYSVGNNLSQLFQEVTECDKCSYNAVIYGLTETLVTIPSEITIPTLVVLVY